MKKIDIKKVKVIAPSLGKRYSGINASMEAVIPEQRKLIEIVGMGFNLDKDKIPQISFKEFIFKCWRNQYRIWHARRNIDMLVGIILKYIFGYKLKLVFTSASQRKHSWLTKFYYHRMDGLIATSKSGAAFLKKDSDLSYHGVNTDRFFPNDNESKKKIGFLSRIRAQKGASDFVKAAIKVLPNHPEWTAELYGETTSDNKEFQTELKDEIKKHNLQDRIFFKGFVDYKNTPDIYRDLDIVICASHVEGFGLPCLEAMASRCAVIATRTGVWKEIIEDGVNGFLVDCKSSEQMAEKLELLLASDKLRINCAKNGYDMIISRFKIINEARDIQKVYDRVLDN